MPEPVSLADQIACVERELAMRGRVYPAWVAKGKMKQAKADQEMAALRAVLATLESLVWRPIDKAAYDAGEILLTDGGMVIGGMWESVDYNEFRGEDVMGWTYGSAEVDPTNFSPLFYRPFPDLPEPPEPPAIEEPPPVKLL